MCQAEGRFRAPLFLFMERLLTTLNREVYGTDEYNRVSGDV